MNLIKDVGLTFDDILLLPLDKINTIKSRKDPDISSSLFYEGKNLRIPIIASPMDSICGSNMCISMDKMGGMGVLTRLINMTAEEEHHEQLNEIKKIRDKNIKDIAVAVGIRKHVKQEEYINRFMDNGVTIICVDAACGYHILVRDVINILNKIKMSYPYLKIIAGNVITAWGANFLADCGVDAIRVGIGNGSPCTTRSVTGCGCPQLTAINNCYNAIKHTNVKIISDGGIRKSSDIIKALYAGASTVIVGGLLSGHDESRLKNFRGMSSHEASSRGDIASEGVSFETRQKGSVCNTITRWRQELKSGLALLNCNNIDELKNLNAIRVSTNTKKETETVNL